MPHIMRSKTFSNDIIYRRKTKYNITYYTYEMNKINFSFVTKSVQLITKKWPDCSSAVFVLAVFESMYL